MKKAICYNNLITNTPFEDGFKRRHSAKIIYDNDEKVIGSITKKRIYDLNGKVVAKFKRKERSSDENGKTVKHTVYFSDLKKFSLFDDKLYMDDDDGIDRLIGRIQVTKRNPSHIIILSALAVFLILVILLISTINLPVEGYPYIDIRDNNGALEAQGTIAVLDDLLKPGDSGEYNFYIRNPYSAELKYSFYIEDKYEGADIDYFPLEFRIKMNNVLIETEDWRTVDKLKFSDLEIMPETAQSFTLEWRWAFNGDNDNGDTLIGADGGKISLVLHLTAEQGGNSL